jgi:hypothetical protein
MTFLQPRAVRKRQEEGKQFQEQKAVTPKEIKVWLGMDTDFVLKQQP